MNSDVPMTSANNWNISTPLGCDYASTEQI